MDMQKERELLKKHTYPDDDLLDRDDLSVCEKWFLMGYREALKSHAVPDGFVVVPKEPTQELLNKMQDFFVGAFENGLTGGQSMHCAYIAMIEAAQELPDV